MPREIKSRDNGFWMQNEQSHETAEARCKPEISIARKVGPVFAYISINPHVTVEINLIFTGW